MSALISVRHAADSSDCEHSIIMPLPYEPRFIDEQQKGRLVQGCCPDCGNIVTIEVKDGKRIGSWLQDRKVESY
jgi:uncharacterized OB-fold protein